LNPPSKQVITITYPNTSGSITIPLPPDTYVVTEEAASGWTPVGVTTKTVILDATSSTNCAKTASFTNTKPQTNGALTMGFWQNKNGQGIIKGASQSALATFLTGYAPFADYPQKAGQTIADYVYGVIKAATCSSTSKTCNSMLKAQMLATALDVYFSDPSLGGNKINAPAPIGGLVIDLSQVCAMFDGSGGGSCSGVFEDARPAFGGANSLSVLGILSYAAGQSNVGGTVWYSQNKSLQVLAKDVFDAINNRVAVII
jgi:hypothetical protein